MPSNLRDLQQAFVDLRFGMFIHFNMATFQDREWGDPSGDPTTFNPTALDTDQWAECAKGAGMTWGCLTTKHHDGFCIWPTKTRSAHVERIDVVREFVDSFRRAGLKTALYFSILDLREDIRHFNVTADKITLIKEQLAELLTEYGEITALIIDGWDAPWSRITYEEVPFHEIYSLVKNIQPNCLVADLNASQYPPDGLYYTDLKAFEQNAGQHLPQQSRVPAFSCVTLTDGWFWKEADIDRPLKSVDQVVNEWLVPQNERHCNLILNAPPNREGRLPDSVRRRLEEIGKAWKHSGPVSPIEESHVITTPNLATGRPVYASSSPDTIGPDMANDGDFSSAWQPEAGDDLPWLEVNLDGAEFNRLVLVSSGVEGYRLEGLVGDQWEEIASGRILRSVMVQPIEARRCERLRLTIEPPKGATVSVYEVGVYREP